MVGGLYTFLRDMEWHEPANCEHGKGGAAQWRGEEEPGITWLELLELYEISGGGPKEWIQPGSCTWPGEERLEHRVSSRSLTNYGSSWQPQKAT